MPPPNHQFSCQLPISGPAITPARNSALPTSRRQRARCAPFRAVATDDCCEMGRPQPGHDGAASDTSLPQSGHLMRGTAVDSIRDRMDQSTRPADESTVLRRLRIVERELIRDHAGELLARNVIGDAHETGTLVEMDRRRHALVRLQEHASAVTLARILQRLLQ
jgi:hypothetical protein